MRDTFKDLSEDLAEANAEGQTLVGSSSSNADVIYCKKMHEEVFVIPEKSRNISKDNLLSLFKSTCSEMSKSQTFDGTTVLPEKDMVRRWGASVHAKHLLFSQKQVADNDVMRKRKRPLQTMPGAFERGTTFNMLTLGH